MSQASTQTYRIRVSEVGPNRRISLASLWALMQETAWENSASLGASTYDLQQQGVTWVLSRGRLEVMRYPSHRDTIRIMSWPSGRDRSFVYRDYRVYDADDQLIAQASTTWLVLDFEARKMVTLPGFLAEKLKAPQELEALERSRGKLRIPQLPQDGARFPVQFHDLDINHHVNNSLYLRWLLESQSDKLNEGQEVSLLEFQLRAECGLGDPLLSVAEASPDGDSFRHGIWRESDQQLIAQGKSVWRKEQEEIT